MMVLCVYLAACQSWPYVYKLLIFTSIKNNFFNRTVRYIAVLPLLLNFSLFNA
jgi:hypothetical protein